MIVKRQNRDTAWFSMLDSEWEGVRDIMEQWLYTDSGASLTGQMTGTRNPA